MRKLFWIPLMLLALGVGYIAGQSMFVGKMAKLHDCTKDEWMDWFERAQQRKKRAQEGFA